MSSLTPATMTLLTPLLRRHLPRYYDVTSWEPVLSTSELRDPPFFFFFFFLLQIEKKSSRRSLPKKMTPDSDVNRGGKSEPGVFFFVGDLLDGFFSICKTKKKKKKGSFNSEVDNTGSQLLLLL